MSGINVICREDVKVKDHTLPCVAVDAGLFYCQKHKLNTLVAIGDFDSLDPDVLASYQGEVIRVSSEKDQSDLELALDYLKDHKETIYVYGALGARMDHCLVNLKLCFYSDLQLQLIDEQNLIFCLRDDVFTITKNEYDYISFLTFEDCKISLSGFKYPLIDYSLKVSDNLTLSNETVTDVAKVEIKGRVLVFYTKEKQES